jgi:retron-type reverse transcriptase
VDGGETPPTLRQWAERDGPQRLYELCHRLGHEAWLRTAHAHVGPKAGRKTAGCEGVDMGGFEADREGQLKRRQEGLKAERGGPQPGRRTYIRARKAGGRMTGRPVGIPASRDRIGQEARRMTREPIGEADFSRHSSGVRPHRRPLCAAMAGALRVLARPALPPSIIIS